MQVLRGEGNDNTREETFGTFSEFDTMVFPLLVYRYLWHETDAFRGSSSGTGLGLSSLSLDGVHHLNEMGRPRKTRRELELLDNLPCILGSLCKVSLLASSIGMLHLQW